MAVSSNDLRNKIKKKKKRIISGQGLRQMFLIELFSHNHFSNFGVLPVKKKVSRIVCWIVWKQHEKIKDVHIVSFEATISRPQ